MPTLSRRSWCAATGAILLFAAHARAQPSPAEPPAMRVEPRTVDIDMFFRGATVRVEGTAPRGVPVELTCTGGEGRIQLKRKGKVWNLLWMNVGTVAFDRVPSLYLVSADLEAHRPHATQTAASTEPGAEPLVVPVSADVKTPVMAAADVGLAPAWDGIEHRILPPGADDGTRRLARELIRLKMEERLYAFERLGADDPPDAAPRTVAAEFALPANVAPGEYEISMIGHGSAAGQLLARDRIIVRRVGLAQLVASTAESHGLLYGIVAVVIAIAAGFVTGVLFTSAKKGH